MDTMPETPVGLLLALVEALLGTPVGLLFVVVLLALLVGANRRPAPVYTVVTLEPPREVNPGVGCLPLLLVVLVVLFAVTFL